MTPATGPRGRLTDRSGRLTVLRRASVGIVIVLVIEAVALVVVLITLGGVPLPVTSSLAGTQRQLAQVDALVGAILLCLLVAVARAIPSRRVVRWAEFSLTSSITVFLIAQLNGISEITTLVAIYALTTGMTLLTVVQDHVEVRSGHPMLPLCFGAAVGIVPWGLIAFQQIGSGLAGDPPSPLVRVITLAMLAAAIVFAIAQWRELRRPVGASTGRGPIGGGSIGGGSTGGGSIGEDSMREDSIGGGRVHLWMSAIATSVFAWLVVGIVIERA